MKDNTILWVALGGIALLLLIAMAKQNGGIMSSGQTSYAPDSGGLIKYKNSETREIIWDYDHMVPTKMVITRTAMQLPT